MYVGSFRSQAWNNTICQFHKKIFFKFNFTKNSNIFGAREIIDARQHERVIDSETRVTSEWEGNGECGREGGRERGGREFEGVIVTHLFSAYNPHPPLLFLPHLPPLPHFPSKSIRKKGGKKGGREAGREGESTPPQLVPRVKLAAQVSEIGAL